MKDNNDYTYPTPNDESFQSKIFKKREFHYHQIPKREKLEKYEDIEKYREDICKGDFALREQQILLTNFLSPDTPYKGLLIMHGTGTGKTCTAISIAEQFKEQVKKYNTKIFILTFGPNNRETFKSELLFCTGETYLKNKELLNQMTKSERELENKIASYGSLQFYKILSYKTFYRKVLGEKIAEKKLVGDNKIKTTYRKNEEGDYEREIVIDKISNMDNSIIIVDEAHNLTGNEYGEALKKIIKQSKNLRVVLLTATPMKNLGDDMIDILNFIRPQEDPIKREKIFTNEKNYQMTFKEGGIEYLKKKAQGYISFFRGSMPFTFAKRVDKGTIPDEIIFTPLIRCYMERFQLNAYNKIKTTKDDALDRASSSASNFVYPGFDSNNKLIGYYSTDGVTKVISQLSNKSSELVKAINEVIFKGKISQDDISNFLVETQDKNVGGKILNLKYLRYFSIKFYKCLNRLNKLVEGKKGASTAFIYSNLVKAGGMEIFAESLKENGYLEYQENRNNYNIDDKTLDYRTGKTFKDFKNNNLNANDFYPATYILITGGSEDGSEDIPEIKQKVIREVFNNVENKKGKYIKFVLGSRVMTEGVTLENVREVHILDVHYNLGKIEQVIGRAIRMCKHQNVITDEYRFPKVNVYRYVSSIKNTLSSDENLYKKAEKKFILVKKIERVIKEVAIDCPILLNGNKFPEEIEKYKGCVEPTLENKKKGKNICPALCDFQECDFKCNDKKLDDFYNKNNNSYRNLDVNEIDHTTFNMNFGRSEIDNIKSKIKDLYRFNHVYTYDQIKNIIISSYKKIQKDLFSDYFLDFALDNMIPKTENDYNNFKDTIHDKYNKTGYLIQRDEFYIFQPFDDNEKTSLYNRTKFKLDNDNLIPIKNYIIKKYGKELEVESKESNIELKVKKEKYDFKSVQYYYEKRDDNFIVGIVDKNNLDKNIDDLFKIRPPIKKTDKKRGTGIYSLTGSVCATSKEKNYLLDKLKKIVSISSEFKINTNLSTRSDICNEMMKFLLYLEKYGTSSKNNKLNYIVIPSNHKIYPFPFNLEDRVKDRLTKVKNLVKREFTHQVKKGKNGKFTKLNLKNQISYTIELKNDKYLSENKNELSKLGFELKGNNWILDIQ